MEEGGSRSRVKQRPWRVVYRVRLICRAQEKLRKEMRIAGDIDLACVFTAAAADC
jgi:hypothetical protein